MAFRYNNYGLIVSIGNIKVTAQRFNIFKKAVLQILEPHFQEHVTPILENLPQKS